MAVELDNRDEIRAFLKSRRDKLTPEQAGLPVYGTRRVSGLRNAPESWRDYIYWNAELDDT